MVQRLFLGQTLFFGEAFILPFLFGASLGGLAWRCQEKLKQSRDTLNDSVVIQTTLMENLSAGVMIIEPSTRKIEYVNETAALLFGADKDSLIGNQCYSFLCPAQEEHCPIYDLDHDIDKSEVEMLGIDGSTRQVIKSVKRIRIKGQEKLLECFIDITEKKQIKAALDKSERYYRLLAENVDDVLWKADLDLNFTYVSPSVKKLQGYTFEEFVQLPFDQMVTPESYAFALQRLEKEIGCDEDPETVKDRSVLLDLDMMHKDGRIIPVEIKASFLRDKAGLLTGVIGITRDISERKKIEKESLNAKKEWERTFDAVSDLIAIIDKNYKILRVNKAMADRLGLSQEEVEGMLCYNVIHGEDKPPEHCPHTRILSNPEEITVERSFNWHDPQFHLALKLLKIFRRTAVL
ncbi:MAG: hypothetical protein CSA29_00570 [Desulfobacterales bacterium]|nr:MAG: hypothetical protein CSA29_00570 [Desulfobacterales bacterium]